MRVPALITNITEPNCQRLRWCEEKEDADSSGSCSD